MAINISIYLSNFVCGGRGLWNPQIVHNMIFLFFIFVKHEHELQKR